MVKVEEIKQFCFTQEFKTDKGTSAFAGHIFAASFDEAEKMVKSFGGKLDGVLVEAQCAVCGAIESHESDEWVDEIGE